MLWYLHRNIYTLGISLMGTYALLYICLQGCREVVQQVTAVWDQRLWFSGTGGPCQGLRGWFWP